MQLKNSHLTASIAFSAMILNLVFASTAFGQGSTGLQINITRTPYLSFVQIPASFSFPSTTVPLADTQIFSDMNGSLNSGTRLLSIQDARNSGGIIVQAQATNLISTTNPSDVIPSSKLRMVSTTSFGEPIEGEIVNNVVYMTGFQGIKNIQAPINSTSTNFGDFATFDTVGAALNTPVDILSGCLPLTQGRDGTFGVGLSYNLTVPGYTKPAQYAATITYTVTDFTQSSCP